MDLLLRAGADVNGRTADLEVTPLTLLLQRAASSSKPIRSWKWNEKREIQSKNERGNENGIETKKENENENENGRENESRRISLGSHISAAHTQSMTLASPFHTHQLGSESDDKTILYADHVRIETKIETNVPIGLGDIQNGSADRDREREGEREGEEKDATCSLEWAATALHLLRSGTLYFLTKYNKLLSVITDTITNTAAVITIVIPPMHQLSCVYMHMYVSRPTLQAVY